MKLIQPFVEQIKAAYDEVKALDNDALRAKTKELQAYIRSKGVTLLRKSEISAEVIEYELTIPSSPTSGDATSANSFPSHSAIVGVPGILSFINWNSVPLNCSSAARK